MAVGVCAIFVLLLALALAVICHPPLARQLPACLLPALAPLARLGGGREVGDTAGSYANVKSPRGDERLDNHVMAADDEATWPWMADEGEPAVSHGRSPMRTAP